MEESTRMYILHYFKLISFHSLMQSLEMMQQTLFFNKTNATCHVSKRTRTWFANSAIEHGFSIMQWPPKSPDMNPIVHLWAHLKLEPHRRYPDTKPFVEVLMQLDVC